MPWESLAQGVEEFPEVLKVLKAALRKRSLQAQRQAVEARDENLWRGAQGLYWGINDTLVMLAEFEQALVEKEEVGNDVNNV